MDIQLKKLNIIQDLLKVNDIKLIDKIQKLLSKEIEEEIKPMSIDEYKAMLAEAEEDYRTGNVISHEDLLKEMKKWGKK